MTHNQGKKIDTEPEIIEMIKLAKNVWKTNYKNMLHKLKNVVKTMDRVKRMKKK